MRESPDPLLRIVQSFFLEYLKHVRGVSTHTIVTYRNALRLFFSFLAKETNRDVSKLRLQDLTAERVLGFLEHLETDRSNSTSTRNCRLACVHTFFRHLIRNDPEHSAQYQRVLSIPFKKKRRAAIGYLEPEEVRVLLEQPDRRTAFGLRDYSLMLLLYNSGARISEALCAHPDDLHLGKPYFIHIHGKGRKDRVCPLWPATAKALTRHLGYSSTHGGGHVFLNARGQPLSRDGADYIIKKHYASAARKHRALRRKHVTPHVFRHSCAVALLQAGVDIAVIRDYLGHESIATTGRYTATNVETKRRVLEAFWSHAGLSDNASARWKPTAELLVFLSTM